MTFTEPFAAYNAASNLEAHFVCNLLNEADIEALVIEDVSIVGGWMGGLLPEVHKPQVWIERADADRARPVLENYEQSMAKRLYPSPVEGMIEVTCEDCGKQSSFPVSQKGSVQNCPHCNAFVDVGDVEGSGEWNEVPGDEPVDS